MDKIWEVAPRKYDDLIDQLLANRGVDLAKKDEYFHPDFAKDLHDPYLMKGIKEAVAEIKFAKDNGVKVGIFADYDADGIPGAALLYRALTKIGIKSYVHIPNREDGYGLSQDGIDYLLDKVCGLIITVDLGIRNNKEAEYCRAKKVKLIITDHHLPGDLLPEPDVLINPKQKEDKYPDKELCGCGVAYKLIQGLSKIYPKEIDEKFLKWNLDLVCISTISDVVPLSGENRVLAKYGLMVIRKTQNLGLKTLFKLAAIKPELIAAYTVGFQVGPRINAPGRMDHATKSFELLVTENAAEASELAAWLNEKNESRQKAMDRLEEEAKKIVEREKLDQNKIIIVSGDWQKGIIGPTASRLVEIYGRPVILFAEEKGAYVGSARSVSAINIVELFEETSDLILKFGGHRGAAGITVEKNNFGKFVKEILAIAEKKISDKDLQKKVRIDAEVGLKEMTKNLYEKVLQLEPFGMGNPKPIFTATGIRLHYPKFVGREASHFSAQMSQGESRHKSIQFNFPYEKGMINEESEYDIAFSLSLDEWQGEEKLSLNIVDIKVH